MKHTDTEESIQRISIIKEFKEKLSQRCLSNEQLHSLYNTIIESIIWERNGDDVKIEINFL